MKKKVTITLVVVLLATICIFPVSAESTTHKYLFGDINLDKKLTVSDATAVQQATAEMIDFDEFNNNLADFNHDGVLSVADATSIQQYSAEMDVPDSYGGWLECNIRINSFYSDYISGSAVKGTPITFIAKASDFYEEITYQFLINDEVVQKRSENNTFIYSFEEAGNYYVTAEAYNKYGFCTEYKILYTVLESENKDVPRITEFHQEIDTIDYQRVVYLHLGATCGTTPYTYSVKVTGYNGSSLNDHDITVYNAYVNKTGNTQWQLMYDKNNNAYLYRDFSADTTILLEPFLLRFSDCYLTVQAKDANGTLSETKTAFSQWNMIG